MSIKPALNQFNGGEISPHLEGRFDWDKYNYSAKLCKNFIPLVEGSLKRRGGSHFVTETDDVPMYYLTLNITATGATEVNVVVNGTTYKCDLVDNVFVFKSAFEYGSIIEYVIQSEGFVENKSTLTITSDTTRDVTLVSLADAATLTIVTKPAYATCIIDGAERKEITVEQGTTVNYAVSYKGTTVTGTKTVTQDETITVTVNYIVVQATSAISGSFSVNDGLYEVIAIGGGGGAGGAGGLMSIDNRRVFYPTTIKMHTIITAGGGGGSAAGYNGNMHLSGTYTYNVGANGSGGKFNGINNKGTKGTDGQDGSATTISGIITLGGGKGGKGSNGSKAGTAGAGGTGTIYNASAVLGSITQGKSGNGKTGGKLGISGSSGDGGDGKESNGNNGGKAYLRIKYLGDYNG
ncbi:MAG: hypothetical protein J6S85_02050 [Methanobrevibacter sp.]|nr:hypothetical protein [Methanobrevibacter sp.]